MIMRSAACILAAISAIAASQRARAQNEDLQQWTLLVAQGTIKGDLIVFGELQPRLRDDVHRLGQMIVRPAIGYRIGPNTTAMAGYAYVRTDPARGPVTHEHRAWQQLAFQIADTGGVRINARSRLEQRSLNGEDELGWRFRQQVRAQTPLSPTSKISGVLWTEPFINLNATAWSGRSGVEQVRSFVGISAPIATSVTLEPGYLNQTLFRRGTDQINHVASLNLFYRF